MMRRCISVLAITALAWLTLVTGPPDPPASEAAFPGYNGKIAYASRSGPGDRSDIWVMDPDGRHKEKVTSEPPAMKLEPTWSPDGTRLAFRNLIGNDIYLLDVGSGEMTNLTADIGEFAMFPAWSPDGGMLAFTLLSTSTGAIDLYTIQADGSELARLTNTDDSDEKMPTWSPDGKKIAFRSEDRGFVVDIAVVNADGSGRVNLTNDSAYDSSPAWSPDGEEIAFASDRVRGGQQTDIFIMKADGSDVRRVSESALAADGPEWSPDGRYLVYSVNKTYSQDLYRLQLSGGEPLRLTASPEGGSDASWQAITTPPEPERPRILTAEPEIGGVGTQVTIHGDGCGEPGDTVTVYFEMMDQVPNEAGVGTAVVDSASEFEISYTIPERMGWATGPQSVSAGRYLFVVHPMGCEVPFIVQEAAPTAIPDQRDPSLVPIGGGPPGGGDDFTLVALGGGMLVFSVVAWTAALRRRSES